MTIAEAYLFKTPLDSDYNNVIDTVNYNGDKKMLIFETMQRSYEYISFQAFSRSVKRVGNSTLLTLPIIYEKGRQYNYLVIEDDLQEYYFYFINSVISENDNTSKPSSTFDLQWDCWNNNIDKFTFIPNNIEIKHYNRFEVDKDFYGNVTGLKPIYRPSQIPLNIPTIKKYKHLGTRYIPAFFKITLKEMCKIPVSENRYDFENGLTFKLQLINNLNDTKEVNFTICDSVNNRYNRNIVYMLAGIFDQEENKFVNGKVSGKTLSFDDYEYDTSVYNFDFGDVNDTTGLRLPDKLTPFISEIELTFNSPFNISSVGTTIRFLDNPIVCLNYENNDPYNFDVNSFIPYIIVGDCFNYRNFIAVVAWQEQRYQADFPVKTYSIDTDSISGYKTILHDKNLIQNEIDLIDPISFTPPFFKCDLAFNNENLNLFPVDNKTTNVSVELFMNTPQPQFKIKTGGEYYFTDRNIFVKNSGFFSLGVDSLQNFLLKNSGQMNVEGIRNIFNMGVNLLQVTAGLNYHDSSMAESGFTGWFNNGFNLISKAMAVRDADKTVDYWVTNEGECDLIYQDRLRLQITEVNRNNISYKQYMNNVYIQGYNYPSVDSPFANSRISFDYVKTVGCDLSQLKCSNEDVTTLQNVFNRGVTKWHIYNGDGGITFSSNMIKDKATVNNLEIFTDSDEEFKQWLNS